MKRFDDVHENIKEWFNDFINCCEDLGKFILDWTLDAIIYIGYLLCIIPYLVYKHIKKRGNQDEQR